MSIEAITWVFKHSEETLGRRLVLLALADYAHDDGSEAYPAVSSLAAKARMSERQVQRALRGMEADGTIVRDGKGPHGTTKWTIRTEGGDNMSGVTNRAEIRPEMSPDPSLDPSGRDFSNEKSPSSSPESTTEPSRPTSEQRESNVKSVPAGSCMSNDVSRATVLSLFSYWRTQCGHPTAKLKRDRERKIIARLREGYTEADIRRAIDGAAKHAFVNENGVRFDDLELICRSSAKLEGFIERASASAAGAQQATVAELMAAYERPRTRTGV